MATILLTAAGTLLGGPIGGAIGALAGRSIDSAILGGGRRDGPRLKELSLTTSSYGQPLPRHHGRMRAGGTIIWATELTEHKDKAGGKKGQPSLTSYSYTTSFAVALSSRPIRGVGRIWADGNLLRGAAGDLKVAGALRIHTGHGDQLPDPLIAAAQGSACPAFRGCAYAVFEDLALGDFGNRIPALTFEVIADEGPIALASLLDPVIPAPAEDAALRPIVGFANEGGPLLATLETIDQLFPLACDAGGERLTVAPTAASPSLAPPLLPQAARAWSDEDFGPDDGRREGRVDNDAERPDAVRYYDVARDFQPGMQRPAGRAGAGRTWTIEFPGALAAEDARMLAEAAARRSGWNRERLMWRVAELDPALTPGRDVRVPGRTGIWRIVGWEWRSRGVDLELARRDPRALMTAATDAGHLPPPADVRNGRTVLAFFEVPPAGLGSDQPTLFAAATSAEGRWAGAALYLDRAGELVPAGHTRRSRATIGALAKPLGPSSALLFEAGAAVDIALRGESHGFASADLAALAFGANRLLVGDEVLQFALAEPIGPSNWRLTGLLRGRGATESAAMAGHPAGTPIVLLDNVPVALDRAQVPSDPATMLAAIGLADRDPVLATLANPGLGRRPPSPVHPAARRTESGLELAWTRRARGVWLWQVEVETPLVEQDERYRVGVGPVETPVAEWSCLSPRLTIPADALASLAVLHPGAPLWVRQVGTFAQSEALLLTRLS
ncbi:phage tail protein [Tsuneonella sp. HG249]